MVDWGGSGKREYPAVIHLVTCVSHPKVWGYFDGWATAQGVDHESLPWHKWLNFVYYFAVRNMPPDDKKNFDNEMADKVTAYNYAKAKPVIESAKALPAATAGQRKRRMPPKPASWGDDARATFDNKAAIQTLTAGGVSGKARRK